MVLETRFLKSFLLTGTPLTVCLVLSFCVTSPAAAAQSKKPAAASKQAGKAPSLNYKIKLTDGKSTVVRTRRELGIRAGEGRSLVTDLGSMKDALTRIAPKFKQDAVDAKPFVYKGTVRIDPGTYARSL